MERIAVGFVVLLLVNLRGVEAAPVGQEHGTDTAKEEAGVINGGDVQHGAHVPNRSMCPLA